MRKSNSNTSTARHLVEVEVLAQFEAGNFNLNTDTPNSYKCIIQTLIEHKYARTIPLSTVARNLQKYKKLLKAKSPQ